MIKQVIFSLVHSEGSKEIKRNFSGFSDIRAECEQLRESYDVINLFVWLEDEHQDQVCIEI